MSEPDQPEYNPIFGQLVPQGELEGDLLPGMVTYSLYKIAKREWATDFFKRNGRKPVEAELNEYIRTWTPTRIAGVRKEAEFFVASFSGSVLEDNAPRIREEALKGTFWRSVGISIFSALLYTLLLIALVIVLRFAGIDLLSLFQTIA